MISVVMRGHHLELQEAVDFVGMLCKMSIERFEHDRRLLPSWGPEIDRAVAMYVQGLDDWIIANAEWSFVTERYFGKEGPTVKKTRQIALLPQRPRA